MEQAEEGWSFVSVSGVLVITFAVLYALRLYLKGAQFREKVNAKGKVILVTGASAGIGRQLVRELNLRGGKVYMLCRSVERGNEAKRDLVKNYGCDPSRMIVSHCDLDSFSSVRKFCTEFAKEEKCVDVLINNAGVMFKWKYEITEDGNEVTLQSNHLGHFLLTELLLPMLEASPDGGRIVNVSSKLHLHADSASVEKMNSKRHFGMINSYARSKLANVMHAVEMTKRIRSLNNATRVTINSCHPGCVDSDLVRFGFYQKFVKPIAKPFIWYAMKTAQDGAQTPLYVALSKKVNGISGKYFSECNIDIPHPLATDESACQILYNESVEATKLKN